MEHVQRRGGRYFLRLRVPPDLADRVGRREIVRRLDTSDYRVARGRAARLHVDVLEIWEQARGGMSNDTALGIREMVNALLAALDETTARVTASRGSRPTMLATAALRAVSDLAEDARADLPRLLREVATAEEESGATARAAAVASTMDVDALTKLEGLLFGLGLRTATKPTPTVLSFLDTTYIVERRLRDDAQRHVIGYVRLFAKATNDKPLGDYKRTDIIKWVRVLEKMRTSYGKRKGDDIKTIEQLLKESRQEQTLNRTTIEKHITHVKAMFLSGNRHHKWCTKDDVEELFFDIPLSANVPGAKPRKSWTIEQLGTLLASPTWSGTRSRREDLTKRHEPGPQVHRDAYWWLPVAALWTGARLEELAQLHHVDLLQDRDGLYYLRIHDGGSRKVKNPHSIRNVPVHQFLVSLGFLDLFRSGGRGRIWPELKAHGRPPSWGALYSSHFTDYRRACGLYERFRDFHSLRRTFISMMRHRAKIHPLTIAAIVGHDDSDAELKKLRQTDDYTDYSIASLAEAVSKLDYAAYGLDSNILTKTAACCGPRGSTRVDEPQ
jgi:integrase